MSELALYRKYRSQTFEELIGQDHVVSSLRNAINLGKISHSYLFTGPRGTGKTSAARLLAKCICADGGPTADPDPNSETSQLIATGDYVDVIEMDAASESGVDQVRDNIVEAVNYLPMVGNYKVFIIDEVHDLSRSAFDALLKTIEEPPPHVIFILATTEYQKVPPTIRSRCQKFEFHRGSTADIENRLRVVAQAEKVEVEPAALNLIARLADGGYRDALSLLEQCLLTADGKLTADLVRDQLAMISEDAADRLLIACANSDAIGVLAEIEAQSSSGRDPRSILESLLQRLADLTLVAYDVPHSPFVGAEYGAMRETVGLIGQEKILSLRQLVSEIHAKIREVTLPRIWLESVLLGGIASPVAGRVESSVGTNVKPPKAVVAAVKAVASTDQKPPVAPAKVAKEERGEAGQEIPEPGPAPKKSAVMAAPEDLGSAWNSVLEHIPDTTPMALRLKSSVAVKEADGVVTIQVDSPQSVDWLADPKRMGYVTKQWAERVGTERRIVFVHSGENDSGNSEPRTVELPLEGSALFQKAQELLLGDS